MNISRKLYRSEGGEVRCVEHLPRLDSGQWEAAGWRPLGEGESTAAVCRECDPQRSADSPPRPLVLNVDDRPATLYLRDRALSERGFVVVNADSGRTALSTARRIRPALILLDVHLPDVDGRELCASIKGDPDLSGIPIVLISATLKAHTERTDSVRDHLADAFLMEPVEPDTLAHTLRKVLGPGA